MSKFNVGDVAKIVASPELSDMNMDSFVGATCIIQEKKTSRFGEQWYWVTLLESQVDETFGEDEWYIPETSLVIIPK